MKASVFQRRNGIQLSYDSAEGVNSTHVYPRRASNGSTVIVYGHETGLRVVWYAGRKFKSTDEVRNGSGGKGKAGDLEVIDLDDSEEEIQTVKVPPAVAFEDDDEEVDPSEPYCNVLRHLDIPLGAAALHVAGPEASLHSVDENRYPPVLQDNLVVAVACSDLSIRLVTCPLQPPRPGLENASEAGVQSVRIPHGTPGYHQDFVTSIAMTFTDQQDDSVDGEEDGNDQQQDSVLSDPPSAILIASTSVSATGILLVHQVSVHGKSLNSSTQNVTLIRRVRLRLPLASAKLAFSPSLPPSERHSNLLVTAPDAGCVKLYQVFPRLQSTQKRRRSNATIESISSRGSWHHANPKNGKILLDLLPSFVPSDDAAVPLPVPARRKRVLDSKWVMGGRAVLGLLEDGEFGIWDVEAVGPISASAGPANKNPIQGQTNFAGIVGASISRFAVAGRFPVAELSWESSKPSRGTSSGLAPATPHTRKVRAQGLFEGGSDTKTAVQAGDRSTVKGTISIWPTSERNESVILSYDSSAMFIPSVTSFWQAAATSGKTFVKVGTFNGPVALPAVAGVAGEPLQDIALLPFPFLSSADSENPSNYGEKAIAKIPNFIATTSTRLILHVQPLDSQSNVAGARAGAGSELVLRDVDKSLVMQSQELDVDIDTLDQILDKMEASTESAAAAPNTTAGSVRAVPNFGKSVLFEVDGGDNDMDVEMAGTSPSLLPVRRNGSGNGSGNGNGGGIGSLKSSITTTRPSTRTSARTSARTSSARTSTQRKLFS